MPLRRESRLAEPGARGGRPGVGAEPDQNPLPGSLHLAPGRLQSLLADGTGTVFGSLIGAVIVVLHRP